MIYWTNIYGMILETNYWRLCNYCKLWNFCISVYFYLLIVNFFLVVILHRTILKFNSNPSLFCCWKLISTVIIYSFLCYSKQQKGVDFCLIFAPLFFILGIETDNFVSMIVIKIHLQNKIMAYMHISPIQLFQNIFTFE